MFVYIKLIIDKTPQKITKYIIIKMLDFSYYKINLLNHTIRYSLKLKYNMEIKTK